LEFGPVDFVAAHVPDQEAVLAFADDIPSFVGVIAVYTSKHLAVGAAKIVAVLDVWLFVASGKLVK
jgi:hypothetical protein